MTITPLDLVSAVALAVLAAGISGVTYRALALLVALVPPKPHWIQRGCVLTVLALAYIGLLLLDVPSLLAALAAPEDQATLPSVLHTATLAAWLWTLNTILLMLARGKLGAPK